MQSKAILNHEVSNYLILTDQLKGQFAEIDDETLRDTLEGISDFPDLIQGLVRSSLEDETLIGALKVRLENMQERLARLRARFEKKRTLACWALTNAELDRLQAEDFSVSLRQGHPRLEVVEEGKIPGQFFIPQPPRLDRAGLINALKQGQLVDGALLVAGEPHIAVHVR